MIIEVEQPELIHSAADGVYHRGAAARAIHYALRLQRSNEGAQRCGYGWVFFRRWVLL